MALLKTFPHLSQGTVGRLAALKQYWEIRVDGENSSVEDLIYLRRRVTLVTLQLDVDYQAILPTDIGNMDLVDWLQHVVSPAPLPLVSQDWIETIVWLEQDGTEVRKLDPPDNDGKGDPTSGMWLVESKDIVTNADGSATVSLTLRNEGAWIFDWMR